MISVKPASELHPNLSTGFLFRKPLRIEAARTLKERGIRMVFSKITESIDNGQSNALILVERAKREHSLFWRVILKMRTRVQ